VFQSASALTTSPSCAELVLLPLAVALAQLPLLPVEDRPRQAVATLPAVELHEDAPAVCLVVNVGEEVERLGNPAQLADGPRQRRRATIAPQGAQQFRRADRPELQGAGHAQQILPVGGDELSVDPLARHPVERAVVGPRVEAPEARLPDVRQPR